MFFKFLTIVAVVFVFASNATFCSNAIAQCGCKSCGNLVSEQPIFCGANSVWKNRFFDCCRIGLFDFEICDACCSTPYISAFGGWQQTDNFFLESTLDPTINLVEEQGASSLDGWGGGGAIGYRVHPMARVEAEFSYRENVAETWFINEFTNDVLTSSNVVPATGVMHSYAGMFNATLDLSPPRMRCLNLYSGAGLGIVTVDGGVTTATNFYEFNDSSFAYQFIGGLNFPLTRRVELYGEYKYLRAEKIQVNDVAAAAVLGDFVFDSHNFFFGVRFCP